MVTLLLANMMVLLSEPRSVYRWEKKREKRMASQLGEMLEHRMEHRMVPLWVLKSESQMATPSVLQ